MRTGLTKQEKTTDIWFDEKDPLIYIRTHNTDLKKRLAAYAGQHPDQCRQTDADPDTGYMEFEIRKGWFSFLRVGDCNRTTILNLFLKQRNDRTIRPQNVAKSCGNKLGFTFDDTFFHGFVEALNINFTDTF